MTPRTTSETANHIVRAVNAEVSQWHDHLDHLAAELRSDLLESSGRRPRRLTQLAKSETTARSIVVSSPRIFGCGFIGEPTAFADAPGLVWVIRDPTGAPNRLVVDAGFYGYTTALWWVNSLEDDQDHTTGPYVDASGTNQYVVTHSRRVIHEGGLVGVLAVDVLVSELQKHLQTGMASLPLGSCIVDHDDAVLVTNTGRLLGMTRGADEPAAAAIDVGSTGWKLMVGATGDPRPRLAVPQLRASRRQAKPDQNRAEPNSSVLGTRPIRNR